MVPLLFTCCLLVSCMTTFVSAQVGTDPVEYGLVNTDLPSIDASPVFAEPPEWVVDTSNQLNFTLYTREYRHSTGPVQFTTRAYCSERDGCSIVGPTWRIKQGARVTVTLTNQLGADTTTEVMNSFHSPNRTNIHTHGLHIDPSVDTVFIKMNPGESHTYNYVIPSNHAPGIHWYHSHLHGGSSFQISGGLAGAIIVDSVADDKIPPSMQSMHRHTVVFQHIFMDWPPSFTTSHNDPFAVWSHQELAQMVGSTQTINPVYTNTNIRDVYLTNGQYQPVLTMYAGEYRIFDTVNAVGSRYLELEVRTGITSSDTNACELIQIASDGVYFKAMRTGKTFIILLPATRQSFFLRCSTPGTYYLQSYANSNRSPVDTEVRVSQNLLTLNVLPGANATGSLATTLPTDTEFASIRRPTYLQDLSTMTVANTSKWSISVEQTGSTSGAWLGIGSACPLPCYGRADCQAMGNPSPVTYANGTCTYATFPGSIWSTPSKFRYNSTLGRVEELSLYGRGLTAHPLHIHVNHMQFISYSGGDASLFGESGDWRDTWPALAGYSTLRLLPMDFTGEAMIHCHFLKHEDTGMMASVGIFADPNAVPSTSSSSSSTGVTSSSTATLNPNTTTTTSSSTGIGVNNLETASAHMVTSGSHSYLIGLILLAIGALMTFQ